MTFCQKIQVSEFWSFRNIVRDVRHDDDTEYSYQAIIVLLYLFNLKSFNQ